MIYNVVLFSGIQLSDLIILLHISGLSWQLSGKESACQCRRCRGSVPGLGRSAGEGKWQLTPVSLPGESHGQRNLVGSGPVQFSSVQPLSHVLLLVIPWTEACQAFQSITSSRSLLKLMSIESVMPPNHLILCCPRLLLPSVFPSICVFSSESVHCQSIGASASTSVLPMNIQD